MAEKDMTEKTLEAYNDVFADIVNVLLFKGEQIVQPDDLVDETPRSMYKADGQLHEEERDVAKYWKESEISIALYGVENQTVPDRDMPLRVIGYDGASYRRQLLKDKKSNEEEQAQEQGKENKDTSKKRPAAPKVRYPVVTLVLYFGYDKHWNQPLSLSQCFTTPDVLKPYVQDYKINLFEIAWLEDEQVKMFKSDFRFVADYFVQMRKDGNYQPTKALFEHVDETLKLMAAVTHNAKFEDSLNDTEGGGAKSMYDVFERAETKGKESMLLDCIRNLMDSENIPAEKAMEKLKIPAGDHGKYLSMLSASPA